MVVAGGFQELGHPFGDGTDDDPELLAQEGSGPAPSSGAAATAACWLQAQQPPVLSDPDREQWPGPALRRPG